MIKKFIKWFISPTEKFVVDDVDVYSKLIELQQRIEVLEAENVETTNTIYEVANSLEARIDILALDNYTYKNFTEKQ